MLKREELDNIKAHECLCTLQYCTINGVVLEYEDFGSKGDMDMGNAEPYGCGDMQFIPDEEIEESVLCKYNITVEEARQIQDKLQCLSFGKCGWCV